jgi:WD40 repeat protein
LSTLLQDAKRFLLRHYQTLSTWPLQIYSSAIVFSPQASIVRRNNLDKIPAWLRKIPRVEDTWASLIQTLAGHSHSVHRVAFSPDGKQIVSGSLDKTIKLWDSTTGDLQKTLTDHSESVHTVAFSPDGKQIASGSWDKTIKLWDITRSLKSSRLLGNTLQRHFKLRASQTIRLSETIDTIKFSANGRYLVTNLGSIRVESILTGGQNPNFDWSDNICVRNQWIYFGAAAVFRLPPDFKPECYDVRGGEVTIGFHNGRILSFDIDRRSLYSDFVSDIVERRPF